MGLVSSIPQYNDISYGEEEQNAPIRWAACKVNKVNTHIKSRFFKCTDFFCDVVVASLTKTTVTCYDLTVKPGWCVTQDGKRGVFVITDVEDWEVFQNNITKLLNPFEEQYGLLPTLLEKSEYQYDSKDVYLLSFDVGFMDAPYLISLYAKLLRAMSTHELPYSDIRDWFAFCTQDNSGDINGYERRFVAESVKHNLIHITFWGAANFKFGKDIWDPTVYEYIGPQTLRENHKCGWSGRPYIHHSMTTVHNFSGINNIYKMATNATSNSVAKLLRPLVGDFYKLMKEVNKHA